MHPRVFSFKVIGYLIFLYVLDATLMPALKIGIFQPSLLYLMILYAAFKWHWRTIIPVSILIGIMNDFMSTTYWGIETLILGASAYVLFLFVRKIERYSMMMRVATTFVFILIVLMLKLIAEGIAEELTEISWIVLLDVFGMALASALVLPLFFYLSSFWFRDSSRLKQYELF